MSKLNVLLLGAGGREHALAWKINQSLILKSLFVLPGSDAIAALARCLPGNPCDAAAVVKAAQEIQADLVVIGPESPLAEGVSDALRAAGFPVFGPDQKTARLESSKAFAKSFMIKHGIPTARHETFTEIKSALAAIERFGLPLVVKTDGLAAGKGVFICKTKDEARAAVSSLLEKGRLLIEECLSGPELSAMALVDGKNYFLLPLSRDHKRLRDNDEGPNTGGMGAYAPVPIDQGLLEQIKTQVFARALAGLNKEGLDYRGILYAGLMLTKNGPKVLEFNCRLGDPEAQAVLPILGGDFLKAALSCAEAALDASAIKTQNLSCLALTLASAGYPEKSSPPQSISGLGETGLETLIFHAGTKQVGKKWMATGGRVLTVCATAQDLSAARASAYQAARKIGYEGMQYRKDIGRTAAEAISHG